MKKQAHHCRVEVEARKFAPECWRRSFSGRMRRNSRSGRRFSRCHFGERLRNRSGGAAVDIDDAPPRRPRVGSEKQRQEATQR